MIQNFFVLGDALPHRREETARISFSLPDNSRNTSFPIGFPHVKQRKPSLKPVKTTSTNEVKLLLINKIQASCTSSTVSWCWNDEEATWVLQPMPTRYITADKKFSRTKSITILQQATLNLTLVKYYCSGCQNVTHSHQPQSFSRPFSSKRSNDTINRAKVFYLKLASCISLSLI